jgi:hypothetical protein
MAQQRLALPQPGERFSFGGRRRNVGAAQSMEAEAELATSQRRHRGPADPIRTAELNDRRDLVFTLRQELANALRYFELGRRQILLH